MRIRLTQVFPAHRSAGIPGRLRGCSAPELAAGQEHFDAGVDGWCLGVVVFELAGAVEGSLAWKARLGSVGIELVNGLVAPKRAARLEIESLPSHRFFSPETFSLGGMLCDALPGAYERDMQNGGAAPLELLSPAPAVLATGFAGARHEWNLLTGQLAPEILLWLLADPALQAGGAGDCGSAEWLALNVQFEQSGPTWRCEEGRKMLIAGRVGATKGSAMCGLRLLRHFPVQRAADWLAALWLANACAVEDIAARAPRSSGSPQRNAEKTGTTSWRPPRASGSSAPASCTSRSMARPGPGGTSPAIRTERAPSCICR